jgi:hypothetical protein
MWTDIIYDGLIKPLTGLIHFVKTDQVTGFVYDILGHPSYVIKCEISGIYQFTFCSLECIKIPS